MPDSGPVLRSSGWNELIESVAAQPDCAALAQMDPALARAVLAAPAAIALWVSRRLPQLAGRKCLRLLVIGAETVDAVDEGRWYALLPRLTGAGGEVAVTLVGAELDRGFASQAAGLAPAQPARCARMRLSEFLGQTGGTDFDLAAMFHPGLPKHRGWLEDGSFARLIAAGVPLMASSYEEDEFEMDGWVVESYGYGVEGTPVVNPFFLDLDHDQTRVRWGRALWGFAQRVPPAGYAADRERLAGLETLSRMVMHSMTEVRSPGPDPGTRLELTAQTGSRLELIHIFDNRFVDPATRRLLRLDAVGALDACGQLTAAELGAYPGAGSRMIERAIWAAQIKAAHLLASYSRPGQPVAPQEKAGSMFATLRARAARLFGKQS